MKAEAATSLGVRSRSRRRYTAGLIILVVLGLALAACSTSLDDLAEGDCFDDPTELQVQSVPLLSCEEPHDNEVFALFALVGGSDAPYPGDLEVAEDANILCLGDFESYVGVSYFDSSLDIAHFTPTRESWDETGDRGVVCALYNIDFEKLVESVKGTGQ